MAPTTTTPISATSRTAPDALNGTNINLTGVPTNLYQGGFHNFNPNPGQQDIAQTVNVPATPPATNFQWDDPYNQVLDFDPNPIYTDHGDYTNMAMTFTTPSLTAGQKYVLTVTADPGSSFDAIVTIKDPNGNTIVNNQDTGTDETINLFPPVTGAYTIIVTNFGGTMGPFTVNVYNGLQSGDLDRFQPPRFRPGGELSLLQLAHDQ